MGHFSGKGVKKSMKRSGGLSRLGHEIKMRGQISFPSDMFSLLHNSFLFSPFLLLDPLQTLWYLQFDTTSCQL